MCPFPSVQPTEATDLTGTCIIQQNIIFPAHIVCCFHGAPRGPRCDRHYASLKIKLIVPGVKIHRLQTSVGNIQRAAAALNFHSVFLVSTSMRHSFTGCRIKPVSVVTGVHSHCLLQCGFRSLGSLGLQNFISKRCPRLGRRATFDFIYTLCAGHRAQDGFSRLLVISINSATVELFRFPAAVVSVSSTIAIS